jgi:hypothetical protein
MAAIEGDVAYLALNALLPPAHLRIGYSSNWNTGGGSGFAGAGTPGEAGGEGRSTRGGPDTLVIASI